MSAEQNGEEALAPYFVGKREDIVTAKRVTKFLGGRDILVIYHGEKFYAMDAHCYHAGGQLELGDIEEFNHKLCIVCPRHKYKITLAEGEGLYRASHSRDTPPRPRWYTKGIKQRVHTVLEEDGDVYVRMSEERSWIESDYYQTEELRLERQKCAEICPPTADDNDFDGDDDDDERAD